jgi:hypothetical protein
MLIGHHTKGKYVAWEIAETFKDWGGTHENAYDTIASCDALRLYDSAGKRGSG